MRTLAVAFYLPQYHPTPENDEWWGTGFTDWRNVARARPRFRGHHQPHIPADLGFYDLRLAETRSAQAALASTHGLTGFCYYHYWFGGRRLLHEPFDAVLAEGEPDLGFCLCWANENWTRIWDGREADVLAAQAYSPADDLEHIRWLASAFADPRYIRVDGRPLFLVYRANRLPDPRRTTDLWREESVRLGVGDPFLCRVESFPDERGDPRSLGFDAAVEFQPDWARRPRPLLSHLVRSAVASRGRPAYVAFDYDRFADRMSSKPPVDYVRFPCVTPGWDNTARRERGISMLVGSTPSAYEQWLRRAIDRAPSVGDDRLVFINAWNEWAEGCHLEPDSANGSAYLEATRRALAATEDAR